DLNKKSNYLGHNIRKIFQDLFAKKFQKDNLIIVFMDKNIDVYISFLAILKAGGAFVPIDPEDPIERIKYIIDDTKAPIVITQEKLLIKNSFLQKNNYKIILIEDVHNQKLEVDKNQNLSNINCPQDLAYVMYTSGTTGRPKGVKIEHKGVTRLVKNTNYVTIIPEDRIMQASKIFFDASTFEIWGALLNGAVSCVVDKNVLLQPQSLANYISQNKISISFLTTGLFNELASQDISVFYKLRKLYIGGEAARPDLIKTLIDSTQAKNLIVNNIYGPTECTTFSTYFVVKSLLDNASSIPIGKPISGAKCYILNDYLELLPAGVSGELCISGPGVARGYLNNIELNNTKFILNPYAENKNFDTFLYRTGDLACYLDNGDIEIVGRIDQQVKLRGYRIELKEIEICLSAHPGIQRCAVKLKENSEKRKIIIAYFVQNNNKFVDQEEIISYLKQKLPQYMIPGLFMELDSIPLTRTGKVDYNALPDPIQHKIELSENNRNLESEKKFNIENEVLKIWQEILELGNINSDNNFFDIGGDSLLLMRLHSKLENLLKKEIPLSILFEYTNISTQSSYLNSLISEKDSLTNIIFNSWKLTLETNKIDINDNFFDIGGNSLLLMRLHNNLENSLKKSIPLNELFTYTTISEQVNYFSNQKIEFNSQLSLGESRAMKRLAARNISFAKIVNTNIENQL
ncbi:non-ribosomal peptide synthetase, partial [Silvanigrella aquatica]|uniref:non-ribosomal peptide synthetase n=1 Tax=Silvanigrella aquatica TaxID=1915309 RepID=UPI0011E60803